MKSPSRFFLIALAAAVFIAGCAGPSTGVKPPAGPMGNAQSGGVVYSNVVYRPLAPQDVFHTVEPKETLYRISKLYHVTVEDIMKVNGITDPTKVQKGQKLRIPLKDWPVTKEGVAAIPNTSIPLYPNQGHWKYIVIHHTATKDGNMDTIDVIHKHRGFGELGYHFIIDNGTKGKADGEIEIGNRWYEQKDGAHAKASNFNHISIGISLIGNFSETDRVSERQLDSLAYLVNVLRQQYHIPQWRVIRHGDVPGAATECPGTHFPWAEFRKRLS